MKPGTPLLRETTFDEAATESDAYLRSLTPAERVEMVAVLTRAAWEGVGRERERFRKVYSYPEEGTTKTARLAAARRRTLR